MIRFSAGLVVVAIGVLIGGVATSKLSLVYVAIAVSAFALVMLAIGVALKRDELFGDGSEAMPASAGAASEGPAGQPVGAGHVRGGNGPGREDQPKIRPTGPATAAFEAAEAAAAKAAAAKAAAAEAASKSAAPPTVAAPSVTIPPVTAPAEQRQHAYSQASARVDETVADWDTRPPQAPWSPGGQGRQSWVPREQAPREQAPSGGWGSSADQSAPPSWFDRLNQPLVDPATAAPAKAKTTPAKAETEPPKAGPFAAFAAKTSTPDVDSPAAAPSLAAAPSPAAADVDTDDDDWPTRYSWLEDGDATDGDTDDGAPDGAGQPDAAAAAEVAPAAETVAVSALSPDTVPAKTVAGDEPIVTADSSAESAETPAVTAAHEDEAAGAEEAPAPQNADAKLVTVIPGVPRYHDPDCILIRFMDEGDIARKSIPEAQAANCTPCAACQPEG